VRKFPGDAEAMRVKNGGVLTRMKKGVLVLVEGAIQQERWAVLQHSLRFLKNAVSRGLPKSRPFLTRITKSVAYPHAQSLVIELIIWEEPHS
jgi:hypothetical protein